MAGLISAAIRANRAAEFATMHGDKELENGMSPGACRAAPGDPRYEQLMAARISQ